MGKRSSHASLPSKSLGNPHASLLPKFLRNSRASLLPESLKISPQLSPHSCVILLLTGVVLTALSFPTVLYERGLPWLAFISLTPILYLSYYITLRQALWYTVWFGALLSTLFAWWTKDYYTPALFGAAMLTAIAFLPMLPMLQYVSKRSSFAPLLHPFIWVAFEFIRIQGVFGNPFAIMGYSQFRSPDIIQITQYTGVWGVSFFLLLGVSLLAALVQRRRWIHPWALGSVAGTWGLILLFIVIHPVPDDISLSDRVSSHGNLSIVDTSPLPEEELSLPEGRPLRVAIVQHSPPFESREAEINHIIALSTEALAEDPDFFLWPETVIEGVVRVANGDNGDHEINEESRASVDPEISALMQRIAEFQRGSQVPLVFGAYDKDSQGIIYNTAFVMVDGEIVDQWYKRRLVPFIEYSPLRWFPLLDRVLLSLGFGTLSPGESWEPLQLPLGSTQEDVISFVTSVCFEESFGSLINRGIEEGGAYIINLTNDSWAAGSYAQWQHFAMGVFRAVEQQSYLIRSASSGISGRITPSGRWEESYIESWERDYVVVTLPPVATEESLYRRWGDWFALFSLGVTVVALLLLAKGCMQKGVGKTSMGSGEA